MIECGNESLPNRRELAQSILTLGSVGLLTPALLGDDKDKSQEKIHIDEKAYAEAVGTMLRYRFGKQLSEEQIKRLQSIVVRQRTTGEQLKRTVLTNSDDPIVAFRADLP